MPSLTSWSILLAQFQRSVPLKGFLFLAMANICACALSMARLMIRVRRWCWGTQILVHPRGTLTTQSVRAEAGRLYGPGIFDMKGRACSPWKRCGLWLTLDFIPERPVVVLLTCDEETGSQTGRQLVEEEARRAEQALVLEPPAPGGQVKTARKGVGMWKVTARGLLRTPA